MRPTRRHAVGALAACAAAGFAASRSWASVIPTAATPPTEPSSAPHRVNDDPVNDDQVNTGRDLSDRMTAPVLLNGQGPFPFMVDTGANISCVSARLAEALALPLRPGRRLHTVVGVKSHPMAFVEELKVGGQTRRSLAAMTLPLDNPRLGGVLAVDWLQDQRLTLDFARSSLDFAPSRREWARPGRVIVPARRRYGQLTIIDAELGLRRISAMIDSGSEASLCNTPLRRMLAPDGDTRARRQVVKMVSILGEPFAGDLLYLPFLRLGGLELGNVPVVHSDAHAFEVWGMAETPAVLLGMDLLRQFRAVSLDFGRSQVRFDIQAA